MHSQEPNTTKKQKNRTKNQCTIGTPSTFVDRLDKGFDVAFLAENEGNGREIHIGRKGRINWDSSRIVASVFQTPQAIEEDSENVASLSVDAVVQVGEYSTHSLRIRPAAVLSCNARIRQRWICSEKQFIEKGIELKNLRDTKRGRKEGEGNKKELTFDSARLLWGWHLSAMTLHDRCPPRLRGLIVISLGVTVRNKLEKSRTVLATWPWSIPLRHDLA